MISFHARKEHKQKSLVDYNTVNGVDVNYNNKCRFRCIRCGYTSSAWKELRRHVSRSHLSLFNKGSELNPFEYATIRKFHECHLCGKRLLQDAWIITSHNLKQHNRMSLGKKPQSPQVIYNCQRLPKFDNGNMQKNKDVPNGDATIRKEDKENAGDDENRGSAIRKSSRKMKENKRYLEACEGEQEIQGENWLCVL